MLNGLFAQRSPDVASVPSDESTQKASGSGLCVPAKRKLTYIDVVMSYHFLACCMRFGVQKGSLRAEKEPRSRKGEPRFSRGA